MKVLQFEQRVPKKVSEIFPFFCDEKNLELLTPPWLQFAILKKIHHISCFWQSRIESWQPNLQFVDVQTKGPYAIWHHTHQERDKNKSHDKTLHNKNKYSIKKSKKSQELYSKKADFSAFLRNFRSRGSLDSTE
jgi:ligand-binding SRPBCC domain-containing protein